jgi:eukaryotic-like serine/threonine-protein kinase
MPVIPGTLIGRYEVSSLIGSGGMGEIYLARDTQLGRRVALKILPEKFIVNRPYLRRFEQEARATSALNHPNILTIYEIGQFESTYFIAAEFVEGETIREAISPRPLTLSRATDVAMQVCSGLAAAHAMGVIHRDVKPENIMVRQDGYVKLLDFGLAKLIQDELGFASASGGAKTETASGIMVGTVGYMSPEQLRGWPLDARTDVWSLGVVLYEMVVGHAPFHGLSNADVIATILERDFRPLRDLVKSCPPLLDRIVNTALAKDREQRYQSINEVLTDLTELRDQLRSEGRSEEALTLDFARGGIDTRPSRSWAESVTSLNTVATVSLRRYQWLGLGALAIVLLIVGGLFLRNFVNSSKQRAAQSGFGEVKLSKLIDTGKATDAAISPDGKYVAYTIEEGDKQSLWVKQIVGGNSVLVIPPAEVRYAGMTFSPDVNYIFYVSFDRQTNVGKLFRIPILGVTSKKILDDVDTPVSFSPDGSRIAFVRGYPSQKQTALIIANVDGTSERTLATRASPDDFGWKGGPAWSPDGQYIACAVGNYDLRMQLVSISTKDGSQKELLSKSWPWIGRVAWLPDGSGMLMVAKDEATGFQQAWFVSYPGSEVRKVTGDLDEFTSRSLSVTADSGNLVIVQTQFLSNIWIARKGDELHAKQVGHGRSDGLNGLVWTPDDKIIYASRASGNLDLWVMDGDGENRKQLTSESGWNYEPAVSRDGQLVVFTSSRGGNQNIWRMDISGSNQIQLTKDGSSSEPRWSPDGRWIIYKSYQTGKRTLWKVSVDGTNAQQLTDKYTGWPDVSPDGKLIACEYWDERPDSKMKLAVIPVEGGAPLKEFNRPASPATAIYLPRIICWTRDGRKLTYADNSGTAGNLWTQPVDGESPKQLTNFNSERVLWFDWSRDGTQLAVARGVTVSDVVMISRTRSQ